jgi:multidrug efflux system membrane fusion protein
MAVVVALLAGVAYLVWTPSAQRSGGAGPGGRFRNAEGPVPVLAVDARTADVPVYLEGVGTTRALNTVTVRAQVDGKIIAIMFKEGQDVEKGDVLAKIDPAIYQAQLDQAVAKKAQDEATLANARLDLERYTKLVASNAVNRQQLDTQAAMVRQLEAQVKQDQAAVDNAQAMLGYTSVTAPISARTGIRQVDVGNLVRASDSTGIVVLTQLRPISILFTLPQQQFARVNKAFEAGELVIEALGNDNRSVIERGKLVVIDNQVDQTTGTIKLKGEFPNADLQLWPGQFVNVRLLVDTLKQVVVVPTAAVQRGPNGTFVYKVTADGTAAVQPVKVSQQDDAQAVITSGLEPGTRVVTTGFARLSDGSRITMGSNDAASAPGAERPRGAGRRDGNARSQERPHSGEPQGDGARRGQRSEGASNTRASP